MKLKFFTCISLFLVSFGSYAQSGVYNFDDFPIQKEYNGKKEWIYKGKPIPEAQAFSIQNEAIERAKKWACNLPFKIESVQLSAFFASVTISVKEFCPDKK